MSVRDFVAAVATVGIVNGDEVPVKVLVAAAVASIANVTEVASLVKVLPPPPPSRSTAAIRSKRRSTWRGRTRSSTSWRTSARWSWSLSVMRQLRSFSLTTYYIRSDSFVRRQGRDLAARSQLPQVSGEPPEETEGRLGGHPGEGAAEEAGAQRWASKSNHWTNSTSNRITQRL